MDEVHVDVVGAESRQACFAGGDHRAPRHTTGVCGEAVRGDRELCPKIGR
jgi:hypothetical protein